MKSLRRYTSKRQLLFKEVGWIENIHIELSFK